MTLIWYNPDIDRHEKGSKEDYQSIKNGSKQQAKFEILYEFNVTSEQLAEKILNELNQVGSLSRESA